MTKTTSVKSINNFYPRPPCGGRRTSSAANAAKSLFLSTPSVWRATNDYIEDEMPTDISIHALRVEGDKALIYFS